MVKNLAYFPLQTARNAAPVMQAFLESARHAGIRTIENDLDCDAAVIWSVLWNGRMASNQKVWQHYRDSGRPVLIIDVGALHRGRTWKIAVDHINAQGYYGHLDNLDSNRPRQLGVSLKSIPTRKPSILIAMQHQLSLQWQSQPEIESWAEHKIADIRQHTDRPIVIRPHPRCAFRRAVVGKEVSIEKPQRVAGTYDDFDFDLSYHAVVNHNSGPGIQASINQIPAVVDQTSLAWPVAIKMSDIENPPEIDRAQWLIEICHTEYTVEEIRDGLWLRRLESKL